MKDHKKSHAKGGFIQCDDCLEWIVKKNLPTHLLRCKLGPDGDRTCPYCKKVLSSSQSLKSHIEFCLKEPPSKTCQQCPNKKLSSYSLHLHKKLHRCKYYFILMQHKLILCILSGSYLSSRKRSQDWDEQMRCKWVQVLFNCSRKGFLRRRKRRETPNYWEVLLSLKMSHIPDNLFSTWM
jgi:hypothetical protein